MKILKIEGNHPLTGSVRIGGAKNSAVALIPAAILSSEPITLTNVPNISDIDDVILVGGSTRIPALQNAVRLFR